MDSSVWIDFLGAHSGPGGSELRRMIEQKECLAIAGVVVTEVLQRLTLDAVTIGRLPSQWEMLEPKGFETYRTAAALYSTARGKGVSLTTIDALVAALAMEHKSVVFTPGQDFSRIAQITGLVLYRF